MPHNIVPVILAGGEGRRLRPLTAPLRPKPFLKMFSNMSLLQATMMRCRYFSSPVIICDEKFSGQAQNEAFEIGQSARIIGEPLQRGTAAAICCAAFLLREENPFMVVMPSDHFITDENIFSKTVERAVEMTEEVPVILGKRPDSAAERYGYIRTLEKEGVLALQGFTEKPHPKLARKLYETPGVFWNTGIFVCRAQTLLGLFAQHVPEIYRQARRSIERARSVGAFTLPYAADYAAIPSQAIDRAVMERLEAGVVLPLETDWHDVGCWERVFALKFKSLGGSLRTKFHEPGHIIAKTP